MAHLGNTIINGALRVLGGEYVDTINGVTVGSSPKFTDTTYSSKSAASGGTDVSLCTTGEKYTWNNKSNLTIGTTSTTAAAGNHTHTTTIAADSGTSALTMAASTKYKLTAGGSTFIFTSTPNTTYSAATTSANGLMASGDKTKIDNLNVYYGTCATAAATAAKEVTLTNATNFVLTAGAVIGVKFTYSNTASSVTLNVASKGAKSIYYNNAVYTGNSNGICGYANRLNFYMYDGTYWVWMNMSCLDGNTNTIPSAYCDTAAGTAAKTASCTGYQLLANSYIHVIVVNTNTSAGAITLNINGKGAKPIYINGAASSSSNYALTAGSYLVFYNGTNYYFRKDGQITGVGLVNTSNGAIYATSGHTHGTSIATSSGTNQLTLAANTKYAITAGGTSYIFTTPPDNNTWKAQSSSSEGYVASSSGKNNCVWATNGSAAPSWMTNPAIDIDGGEETS